MCGISFVVASPLYERAATNVTSPDPFHPLAHDLDLRRRLLRLAGRWTVTSGDAEDLVQETYLRTARGALPEAGREAWMVTVLRNLCIDVMRRHDTYQGILARHADSLTSPSASDAPEHLADQAQRVEKALRHLLRLLPPGDAALVLLHDVFELDHAQLGEISGRNASASRQHVRRLLLRLKESTRPANDVSHDDDSNDFLSLCRMAVTRRDPAGLIAAVKIATPMALRGMAAAASMMPSPFSAAVSRQPRTAMAHVEGVLGLAIFSGEQQVAWLPLATVVGEDCEA
jgi:RNA polymerase sigma-70 factor (ECF subfamily)